MLAAAGLVLGSGDEYWAIGVLRASIPEEMGEIVIDPVVSWRMVHSRWASRACASSWLAFCQRFAHPVSI